LAVKHSNANVTRNTIGVDLSDLESTYHVIDPEGEFVCEGKVSSTPAGFKALFQGMQPSLVALETGTHSRWASKVIGKCGHEVLVANAREVQPIYQTMQKTDPIDAKKLARLARFDRTLLSPIEQRSEETQIDLATLRSRSTLVEARTKLINHVRGLVKPFGKRIPDCSAPAFHYKAAPCVPEALLPALQTILDMIGQLTASIAKYDQQVDSFCKERYPETASLRQVPGVGPITSLAYVLTVGDPRRFHRSRKLGKYFGLTPRMNDTGESHPQLRITKAGDGCVRQLLVGSAHYILGPFGPDNDLRRFGNALAKRGGKNAKKRAVVAVARKLAVLLHRLWISGEEYRPLRCQSKSPRPQAMEG
jgi:transposase